MSAAQEYLRRIVFGGCGLCGKVEAVKERMNVYGEPVVSVEFSVLTAYKGLADRIITVSAQRNGKVCGFPFKENKVYWFYAYSAAQTWSTSICSRTRELSSAVEDWGMLRKIIPSAVERR